MAIPLINNLKELINIIYPIGSIYMSVNNTNPSILFGGTWTTWGAGKVPVGVNSSDASFNTTEKTGGQKTITISLENSIRYSSQSYGLQNGSNSYSDRCLVGVHSSSRGGNEENYPAVNRTINIVQPYITCHMWKRVA